MKVYIESRTVEYQPKNEIDRRRLAECGLETSFPALSIGTASGTLCLVPLDESSRENAELIVILWNDFHLKNETRCSSDV